MIIVHIPDKTFEIKIPLIDLQPGEAHQSSPKEKQRKVHPPSSTSQVRSLPGLPFQLQNKVFPQMGSHRLVKVLQRPPPKQKQRKIHPQSSTSQVRSSGSRTRSFLRSAHIHWPLNTSQVPPKPTTQAEAETSPSPKHCL